MATLGPKLIKACLGKPASQGGLNVPEFKNELSKIYPNEIGIIKKMPRKRLEELCESAMKPKTKKRIETAMEQKIIKETTREIVPKAKRYTELPKEYCEDYTLIELTSKSGSRIKLKSGDRIRICQELGLPHYPVIREGSMGYPRGEIMAIVNKIDNGQNLTIPEQEIVNKWNSAQSSVKDRLNPLAARYVSGGTLTADELKYLDQELLNKYCRCLLQKKEDVRELLASNNLVKILKKIPETNRSLKTKARKIIADSLDGRAFNTLSESQKTRLVNKLLSILTGLSFGICKSSVYQKKRNLYPRNRKCDDELTLAELSLESYY